MGIIEVAASNEYDKYRVIEAFSTVGTKIRVGKSVFEKDGRIPVEGYAKHDEDEYVYIVKGSISFGTEGEKYCLQKGDFHYMPKGKEHWCRNEAEEESELLYILVQQ